MTKKSNGRTAQQLTRRYLANICQFVSGALFLAHQNVPAFAEPKLNCPVLYQGGTVPFAGLYPAIEGPMPFSRFLPNMIVEIDPAAMPNTDVAAYVRRLHEIPVRVSIYLPGGHCNIENKDCEQLRKSGVRFGPTGSWNWDKDERRIYDLQHPAVLKRIQKAAEIGWRAGANYVRVDNVHNPAGSKEPRTANQLKAVLDALHDVEDRLRSEGAIPADRPTGLVAHNSLDLWEQLLMSKQLRRPPVFLTSERTAQLAYKGQGYRGDAELKAGRLLAADNEEISAGRRLALALDIPYTVAEFHVSHDLAAKAGTTYKVPLRYVRDMAALPGVTEVILIPNETNYIGRGKPFLGQGPKVLQAVAHAANAITASGACLAKP